MNFIETIFPDHFDQTDRRTVFLGVFISVISAWALYVVQPPRKGRDKLEKPIAQFETYSNNVRRKDSGSISYYDVVSKESIHNKDEIFTGDNSTALVRFLTSNNRLKIPSSSLVLIEERNSSDEIELRDGLVDIVLSQNQTINFKSNGESHELKASAKDSVVKAYFSSGVLHLFTKDKGVSVKTAQKETKLIENQDASLTKGEFKIDNSFQILSPTPGEVLDNTYGAKIKTNLKAHYKIFLSMNNDFMKPAFVAEFDGTEFELNKPLEDGDYFLKIQQGKDQKVIPVSLLSKESIDGMSPASGETLTLVPGKKIMLKWDATKAISYKVIINDYLNKTKEYITKNNLIEINSLSGTSFTWSVSPELSPDRYSTSIKSNIINLNFVGSIDLINPPDPAMFNSLNENMTLSWKGEVGSNYIVKVFDNSSSSEVFTKQVNASMVVVPLTKSGSFVLEVESIEYPTFKKAQYKYIVNTPILSWDSSNKKEIFSSEEEQELILKFKANTRLEKDSELLMVYTPKGGAISSESQSSLRQDQKVILKGYGRYCFKAIPGKNTTFTESSDEYCLKFIQIPVFDTLPETKDIKLALANPAEANVYAIKLITIKNTEEYYLEIFSDANAKNLVFSTSSKEPSFTWTTKRTGVYYYRYKVADIKNRESKYSTISKLILPISPLVDW
jgi:hypothetical protein